MISMDRSAAVMADADARSLWKASADRQEFLQKLRASGVSKLESVRHLRSVADISLQEAKEMVHFSPVWDDRRSGDEVFHETVANAINRLNVESSSWPEKVSA